MPRSYAVFLTLFALLAIKVVSQVPVSDQEALDLMESDMLLDMSSNLAAQNQPSGGELSPSAYDEPGIVDLFSESGVPEEVSMPSDEEPLADQNEDGSESIDESAPEPAQSPPETHAPIQRRPIVFCKALAYLQILSTSGTCHGYASASCTAVSEANNAFVEGFDSWFGEAGPGLCATGQANATAVAHAAAIAKVWANALVNVQCDGQGFACGWVYANASSWAIAFAEALATAAAETVSKDTGSGAFCYADVTALSSAFAEAASSVKGDTCTYRGRTDPVEFYQESFASAIQFAISEAYARAVSRTCDLSEDGTVRASSKCEGKAEGTQIGSEQSTGTGTSKTKLDIVNGCTGIVLDKCCQRAIPPLICTPCRGCGPLTRMSRGDKSKGSKTSWRATDGTICFCGV